MGFEVAVAPELLGSVVVTPDATAVTLVVAVTIVVGLALLVTLTLEAGVGAAPPAVK